MIAMKTRRTLPRLFIIIEENTLEDFFYIYRKGDGLAKKAKDGRFDGYMLSSKFSLKFHHNSMPLLS